MSPYCRQYGANLGSLLVDVRFAKPWMAILAKARANIMSQGYIFDLGGNLTAKAWPSIVNQELTTRYAIQDWAKVGPALAAKHFTSVANIRPNFGSFVSLGKFPSGLLQLNQFVHIFQLFIY